MSTLDDLFRFLQGKSTTTPDGRRDSSDAVPPVPTEGRDAAIQAAHEALAPKQSDESHLVIRPFGQNGEVLQHSEEWVHGQRGLKVVTNEIRVMTNTGELVEPKEIRVLCLICGGHDSVVSHCRCGIALCRRCLHRNPSDSHPLCPSCYRQAIETFNTWHQDDKRSNRDSR